MRPDGRKNNELRPVEIIPNFTNTSGGSVLINWGNTRVICTALLEAGTMPFLKDTGKGWLTAEYAMLPSSTGSRKRRETSKPDGRSTEIKRLIGRSLRNAVDFEALGENTIWIDCDVIQADGGTRTASITGAFVAMVEAMKWMKSEGMIEELPVRGFVSAISVGIVEDEKILDLCYQEDSRAMVDMNVVMTDAGEYIEIQGTGEERPFRPEELTELLALAAKGCSDLHAIQKEITGEL